MREIVESFSTAISISGLMNLEINGKSFVCSMQQGKILFEDLGFSLRQMESFYGEIILPKILQDEQTRIIMEKTRLLTEILTKEKR